MSGYDDRVPQEVYEPHSAIVVDVLVAFAVEVQFSEKPPEDIHEWIQALRENIMYRIDGGAWDGLEDSDVHSWMVIDVQKEEE